MNRRTFFATLLAAPIAALAALKAKAKPTLGYKQHAFMGDEGMPEFSTLADTTHWSDATGSPLVDVEAAMAEIRKHAVVPDVRVEAYDVATHDNEIVVHVRVEGAEEATQQIRQLDRELSAVINRYSLAELRRR